MPYDPDKHHRRSIRLPGYDYASVGAYFVTLCTYRRGCFLADIVENNVNLSEAGRLVKSCWLDIPAHLKNASLDAFVIMPNHLHGIIIIARQTVGATYQVVPSGGLESGRPTGPKRGSLAAIRAAFKGASGKRINLLRGSKGAPVWQRDYYEHVIRDDFDLVRKREYIQMNPFRWLEDDEHPLRIK